MMAAAVIGAWFSFLNFIPILDKSMVTDGKKSRSFVVRQVQGTVWVRIGTLGAEIGLVWDSTSISWVAREISTREYVSSNAVITTCWPNCWTMSTSDGHCDLACSCPEWVMVPSLAWAQSPGSPLCEHIGRLYLFGVCSVTLTLLIGIDSWAFRNRVLLVHCSPKG